jgi:lysozyme family protein
MTKFDIAFDYVIENEKGLNNDPTDRGGITKYGISEKFIESLKGEYLNDLPFTKSVKISSAHVNHITIEDIVSSGCSIKEYIISLEINQAKLIYQKYFWLPIYDQIEHQDICNYIFDMTVQHGHKKAAELVQRAINANWRDRFVEIDGIFGPYTLCEVNRHSTGHATKLVFKSCLIAVRESLFRCIVAHDKTQDNKLEGWLKRCYR